MNFAGVVPHSDAKASFSSQIDSLVKRLADRVEMGVRDGVIPNTWRFPQDKDKILSAISVEDIYVEANRMLQDLNQYNEWEGTTLTPIMLGGYYSSSKIREILNNILANTKRANLKSYVQAAVSSKYALPAPIKGSTSCDTLEDRKEMAVQMFGPVFGLSSIAQTIACNRGKILLGGALVGSLIVLAILSPYANLLAKVTKKKKRK